MDNNTNGKFMPDRRKLLQAGIATVGALSLTSNAVEHTSNKVTKAASTKHRFWPNGEQLVISISMQFEASGQPKGAESPFPNTDKYANTIAPTWFNYGVLEGIPRLLKLWDKHHIKVTSHMVGQAVERNPNLAREIVNRGHEASGHGQIWAAQYSMTPDDERASYLKSMETIQRITGQRPVGFNAFWMQHSRQTLEILQDLGFIYHVDDLSRDEPSITPVREKPFAVVPYTLRNNDIGRLSNSAMTAAAYLQEMKMEFDILYAEGAEQRRMMSISAHDRIGGAPAVIHAYDAFITYALKHPGVSFMRKDAIAKWALSQSDTPKNLPRTFSE